MGLRDLASNRSSGVAYYMIIAQLPKRGTDAFGSGAYHASRGSRTHKGIDYACYPNTQIHSPIAGYVSKWGLCYSGEDFQYIEITTPDKARHRFFYVHPGLQKGTTVHINDYIGYSQNIALKYTTKKKVMTNHVHYEILLPDGSDVDPVWYGKTN